MIYDKHMSKQALSVTLDADNVLWLRGRAAERAAAISKDAARDLKTTSFFKRVMSGTEVELLEQAIADNGQQVSKVRMNDGTEGWTSSWHLDLHSRADQATSRR